MVAIAASEVCLLTLERSLEICSLDGRSLMVVTLKYGIPMSLCVVSAITDRQTCDSFECRNYFIKLYGVCKRNTILAPKV